MPEWILDEGSHAGPEHLDAAYVAMFERKAGYDRTDDVDVLIDYGLNPDSVVLDMGAGTGVFAAAVAPRCREVIAVDISPAMTAALRPRVRAEGMRTCELWRPGSSLTRTRGSRSTSCSRAMRSITSRTSGRQSPSCVSHRRSDPEACCVSATSCSTRVMRPQCSRHGSLGQSVIPAVGFTAEDLATQVRTEFSTYSWLLEPMIERAGLSIDDRVFRGSVYGAYTCIRR